MQRNRWLAIPTGSSTTLPDYRSCNRNDDRNCTIYRVRWVLGEEAAFSVQEVLRPDEIPHRSDNDERGLLQPAISPDGKVLAFTRGTGGTHDASIWVMRLPDGTPRMVDKTEVNFPAWYNNTTLLYDKSGGEESYKAAIKVSSTDAVAVSSTKIPLECDGDTCFKDKNVHQAPNVPALGSSSPAVVGTDAGTEGAEKPGDFTKPRVINTLAPANCWDSTMASSGCFLPEEDPETGCAHPAWNISGDRILCTLQGRFDSDSPGIGQRPLYALGYSDDAEQWQCEGLLFDYFSSSELASAFNDRVIGAGYRGATLTGPLFPNTSSRSAAPWAGGAMCNYYHYKYAEWCGNDDYVVVTVYCESADLQASAMILTSRVMLVRTVEGNVRYWDITAAIEDHLGTTRGSVHGHYQTCTHTSSIEFTKENMPGPFATPPPACSVASKPGEHPRCSATTPSQGQVLLPVDTRSQRTIGPLAENGTVLIPQGK